MRAGHIYLIIAVVLLGISFFKEKQKTKEALKATLRIFYTIIPVLVFVFVLMGLIQAYVSRETIASILGQKSGILGILYAEIVGSIALFMPPAVFPFGGYLHNNGASYGSIAGFVFTAILIGITTLPVEIKFLGKRFTIARNIFTFVLAFFISILMEGILMKKLLKNDAFQFLSLSIVITLFIYAISASKGTIIIKTVYLTFFEVLDIIIAVSIFIGLFQVWVKPATIVKLLGRGSGLKGFILVCTFPILMGGSLFTVFPLLKTLKEKGARTGAMTSFITAWGGKAPLLPLETKFLGWPFALVRLSFVVLFAFVMGILMDWVGEKTV